MHPGTSPGTSPLQEAQAKGTLEGRGAIAWGEKGLAFHYTSPKGLEAAGRSGTPEGKKR